MCSRMTGAGGFHLEEVFEFWMCKRCMYGGIPKQHSQMGPNWAHMKCCLGWSKNVSVILQSSLLYRELLTLLYR